MFYTSASLIDCCGSFCMSIFRSMIAACVPLDELGQVFAMWSSMDNLIPLAVSQIYKEIWELTQDTQVGAFFFVSATSTFCALCLCIYFAFDLRGRPIAEVTGIEDLRKKERGLEIDKIIDKKAAPFKVNFDVADNTEM